MKKNRLAIVCLLGVSLLITAYLELSSPEIVKFAYEKLVFTQNTVVEHISTNPKQAPITETPTLVKTDTPPEEWVVEGVKRQMSDISNAYEENIRYPNYSKPLYTNDWTLLNPNAFVEKTIPLDIQDGLSAAIVLPHYVINHQQDLPIQVLINGGLKNNLKVKSIFVYLQGDSDKQQAVQLSAQSSTVDSYTFSGSYPAASFPEKSEAETLIFAEVHFSNDEQVKISAVFKLVGNDAMLSSLDKAFVEGSHLMIPANFDVSVTGYYRVQANLFDEETKQPVSHLNSAFLLSKQKNTGFLRVHASTLRSQGSAGPYLLTDFNITRGPAHPGDKTGYGSSKEQSYKVEGFDLSHYSDEDYVDPQNQQRLEFLQKMAGSL